MHYTTSVLLVFHVEHSEQPIQHAISFGRYLYETLTAQQQAIIMANDSVMLARAERLRFAGGISGTYEDYLALHESGDIAAVCPECLQITKGKANG